MGRFTKISNYPLIPAISCVLAAFAAEGGICYCSVYTVCR